MKCNYKHMDRTASTIVLTTVTIALVMLYLAYVYLVVEKVGCVVQSSIV
jgi:hypothetical protein